MTLIKVISVLLIAVFAYGCASIGPADGARGPELVASGRATESGQYAEVGLEFTTWGDFMALVAPTRWKSPIATGGSLSWLNPGAWSEDAGRTGRILLGEAVVIGGAAAAVGASSSDNGGSGSTGGSGGTSTSPTPPTGGGGSALPPTPEF
jgi:hypothetical protein